MELPPKKVIIFDLDDTLTESRQAPDREMANLLCTLASTYTVAVISGGSIEQFRTQLLSHLPLDGAAVANLLLFPTSGAAMYRFAAGEWSLVYEERLSDEAVRAITEAIETAVQTVGIAPAQVFGPTIQNRGDQVTYSALGQDAPLEVKHLFDPRQEKRAAIRALLCAALPDFEIHIGGTTSIDISKKGVNKAFAIRKLSAYLGTPIEAMLYVGDALYPGGNDAVVTETGIDTYAVSSLGYTKKLIRDLIRLRAA